MTGRKRGPRRTAERLRRLLVMLPWLAERGSVPTAEMAQRFGVSIEELITDLELAAMCGLPPYLDEVLDIIVDEEEVSLGVPRLFTRPLRLTATEAFGLVAAVRTTAALPGADTDGALTRAIDKLSVLVPADEVEVDLGTPPATEDLTRAAAAGRVVQARYWSASAQRTTDRTLEPLRVFSDRGQWYLWALDRGLGKHRVFRLDRFEAWTVTDEHGGGGEPGELPRWFADADDPPTAVLRVDASTAWLFDSVATRRLEHLECGSVEAEVVVVDEGWLGRLLVRLGPTAEVVAPAHWRDLGARSARLILDRYEPSS